MSEKISLDSSELTRLFHITFLYFHLDDMPDWGIT